MTDDDTTSTLLEYPDDEFERLKRVKRRLSAKRDRDITWPELAQEGIEALAEREGIEG